MHYEYSFSSFCPLNQMAFPQLFFCPVYTKRFFLVTQSGYPPISICSRISLNVILWHQFKIFTSSLPQSVGKTTGIDTFSLLFCFLHHHVQNRILCTLLVTSFPPFCTYFLTEIGLKIVSCVRKWMFICWCESTFTWNIFSYIFFRKPDIFVNHCSKIARAQVMDDAKLFQ